MVGGGTNWNRHIGSNLSRRDSQTPGKEGSCRDLGHRSFQSFNWCWKKKIAANSEIFTSGGGCSILGSGLTSEV